MSLEQWVNNGWLKRHEMGYERAWVASEGEAEEMVELAQKLKERVQSWLCNEHPDLI